MSTPALAEYGPTSACVLVTAASTVISTSLLTTALSEYGSTLRQSVKRFWPKLERQLTDEKVEEVSIDSKLDSNETAVMFLPNGSSEADYYDQGGNIQLEFLPTPAGFDDQFIYKISRKPGILALTFNKTMEQDTPLSYVVPGGRFNEFYGWDSYFIARGLLNDGNIQLAAAVADHFSYEIYNYGKILNANRPYYLGRTQPPFLTDLAWKLYEKTNGSMHSEFIDWIKAAIVEYNTVWRSAPRYDANTTLSKYFAQGRGIPPEVEKGHFDSVIKPIAAKHGMSLENFITKYNSQEVNDTELDAYMMHDRAIRESGLDVTTRFVNVCAYLTTIDLNALLYKYETDIAKAVMQFPSEFLSESSSEWLEKAKKRKEAINKFLWNSGGFFCDFNTHTKKQHAPVISATTFYSLWSGLATDEQAQEMVRRALPSLEFSGGLSSTSYLESMGDDSRQWDYPAGWAPHQLLAWEGLRKYGYDEIATRLATKWLSTVSQGALQTNGSIFEKYDVTGVKEPQDVRAEYGNQGSNETGFGWTNAVFAIGYDHFQ